MSFHDRLSFFIGLVTAAMVFTADAIAQQLPDLQAAGAIEIAGDGSDPYAADINGDGRMDLVYHKSSPLSLHVHLSDGNGFAATAVVSNVSGSEYIGAIAFGDVTGDGRDDAVIANSNADGKNIQILRGTSAGGFVHEALISNGSATTPGAAVGDVNNDGKPDLVGTTGSALSVMLNTGAGGFAAPIVSGVTTGTDGRFVVADINDDGKDDIIYLRDHSPVGLDSVSTRIRVHHGNGDGTFTLVQSLEYQTTLDNVRLDLVDSDSLPDLMIYGYKGNANYDHRGGVRILRNTGGQFEMLLERGWLLLPYPSESAELADVNGDGAAEVILVRRSTATDITIWVNDGAGAFPQTVELNGRDYAHEALAFDFTGSGLKDLVVWDNPIFGGPDSYLLYANQTAGSQPVEAALVRVSINPGVRLAGNLRSLENEDANLLRVQAEVTAAGAKWAQLTVSAASPEINPAALQLTTLARVTMPGVAARVWLRNWDTNRWVLIDQYSQPMTDSRKVYADFPNAGAYVRDTDGQIQLRIRYSNVADIFEALVNLVQFDITP